MKLDPALFLDFDGTTHPLGCLKKDYFCRLPFLAQLLEMHPNLKVVISSSWRKHLTLDQIKSIFDESVSSRIVGVTPQILPKPARNGRYLEIQQYLKDSPHSQWIALDDNRHGFPVGCLHFIKVDRRVGLDSLAIAQADFKLKVMRSAPPTSYVLD